MTNGEKSIPTKISDKVRDGDKFNINPVCDGSDTLDENHEITKDFIKPRQHPQVYLTFEDNDIAVCPYCSKIFAKMCT